MKEIEILKGKLLSSISISRDNDEIIFTVNDGTRFKMYHEQDCCESVSIDDINGDIDDLIDSPILVAEESESSEFTQDQLDKIEKDAQESGYRFEPESFTWTFYKIATIKGYVTIRWYGESNGYYSESVYIRKIKS
jgi:hypothetical protein